MARKESIVTDELHKMIKASGVEATVRGRGLIYGVDFADTDIATRVSQACFKRGLVIESAGINDQVLKLLPSLTIKEDELLHGLDIVRSSLKDVLQQELRQAA